MDTRVGCYAVVVDDEDRLLLESVVELALRLTG